MNCFSCFKLSKESKRSWKCWNGRRMCCLCGGKSAEDEEQLKNKGSRWCFFRKKLAKNSPPRKREKCDTGHLCSNGRGRKRKVCCFSCSECLSEVESPRRTGEGCLSCFCCGKSSTEERGVGSKMVKSHFFSTISSPKRNCCIPCCKSSNGEESRKKGEKSTSESPKITLYCIPCFKSSNKDESRKKGERPTSKSPKKRTCCLPCFKASNKKESRKRGDRLTSTSPVSKFSKCKFLDTIFCSSCFNKANKKMKAVSGKKIPCWKRKGKKRMNHHSHNRRMPFNSDSRMNNCAIEGILHIGNENLAARVFKYSELAAATQNFKSEFQLGKAGFGRVYKGELKDTEQVVAVKQLERNENQGNRDFLYEVLMLSLLNHPNLISLRGYCVEGDERLLVYDYMPLGSLQDHLLDLSPHSKPLDWNTRMKIAVGAAKGLQFLHDVAFPPVIHGDLKASNILLHEEYNPKLSDFGIAKISPNGAKRAMGTVGYSAPDYALTGKLTTMSDIYSFGVVLLELIAGRKAMDSTRPSNEQRLVDWALLLFKDEKRLVQMADPLLEGNFPIKALYQAIAVAAQCLQEEDTTRPQIKDVVSALESLTIPDCKNSLNEPEAFGLQGSPLLDSSHIEETNEHTEEEDEDEEENPSQSSQSDWQSCSTVIEEE